MFKIKRYKFLSRKHSIIEKNCSDKSCRIQKGLFTDFISLTLNGGRQSQVKVTSIFYK